MSINSNEKFNDQADKLNSQYISNKRILFLNPIQFHADSFNMDTVLQKGYYVYPPTGLLFLAASIKDFELETEICDLNFEVLKKTLSEKEYDPESWMRIIDERLREFNPSIVAVSCMFSHLKNVYEKVITYILKMDKYCIIAGGTHVTFEYKELLERNLCHLAITKYGEMKLRFALNSLFKLDKNIAPVEGVFFKGNEEIHETAGIVMDEGASMDLDISSMYELLKIEEYCRFGSLNQFSRITGNNKVFTAISMNRGCRGHCTFCSVRTLHGKKIISRSVENIIKELKYLKYHKRLEHFDWLDDDLLANREKSLLLFKRMKDEDLELKWYANNGLIAGSIDHNMLQAMVDSGCIGFKIGIESGNPEMLKVIRKPATLDRLLQTSNLLKNYPDLFVAGNYIIGFPYEKFSQMLDTFIFANRMNLDWSGFYICQPLKGADAFDSFESIGDERCKNKPENYLPVKKVENNAISYSGLSKGLEVFSLSRDAEVSREQLEEVWFVFGFLTNFIFNKNLHDGKIEKFIKWVDAAFMAYPYDSGMALFLYVSYLFKGDIKQAECYFSKAYEIFERSEYWKMRFSQFKLDSIIYREATDKVSILKVLTTVIKEVENRLGASLKI